MIKIIIELTKLRLSLLVTFSAIFGFILASSQGISYNDLFFFSSSILGRQSSEQPATA